MKKLTDQQIERLAEFGARVSRYCRDAWTGEQTRVSVSVDEVAGTGGAGGPGMAVTLEFMGLMAYENIADLHQYRLGKIGQHSWRKSDWERAIKEFKGN